MRNILNIDYTNNDCWGTFNSNSDVNTLEFRIRVNSSDAADETITLNIITDNDITTKNVQVKSEHGLVTYEAPFEDWKYAGVYAIKKADADNYVIINIPENLSSSDKISFRFNQMTMSFEAIKYRPIDPAVAKVYPIGTVYQSTNGNFDPNTEWGGKWSKIEGRFLLGSNSSYALGSNGGTASNTLAAGNIPQLTSASTATSTKSLTGAFGNFAAQSSGQGPSASGICTAFLDGEYGGYGTSKAGMKDAIKIDASHNHTVTIKVGSASPTAITNMPPYKVVNIWERTS